MNYDDNDRDASGSPASSPLKILIPPDHMHRTRQSARLHSGSRSGSSEAVNNRDQGDVEEDEEGVPIVVTKHGRKTKRLNYAESNSEADFEPEQVTVKRQRLRKQAEPDPASMFDDDDNVEEARQDDDDGDDEHDAPRRSSRRRPLKKENDLPGFIVEDDDRRVTRSRLQKPPPKPDPRQLRAERAAERARRTQRKDSMDGDYIGDSSPASSYHTHDETVNFSDEIEQELEDEQEANRYRLRDRAPVNYAIPPPLEEMAGPPKPPVNKRKPARRKGPGWSAGGAELGRWMGIAGDDSDSDANTRTPKKPFGMGGAFDGGVAAGGAGLLPPDFAASGTPSNLGKVTDASLADADPLGVNVNVTFDEVGGLDDHIHSLKEMTLLPLLYPEVFQQFNVTPPRGVLFHGPPGTGKTLLARALAASCRSNGKQISFFMRKGADALSKWVGEAERQLRLLFEEARNAQPSIIFFDEIDGLAPVRSSKQDQIHASIVSTLLALMDGMDGRGQVVVIGATNRPDAIDPALRRPGRFDREFYFPLPKLEAREKILSIMTKSWQGWSGDEGQNKLQGLAKMTKGYGGADLRALCTEAALNAVQRKYPQIYKSNDRLLLQPDSITVGLRDFMITIKKMVPSSARSSASVATPLPPQFEPLLSESFEAVKVALKRVLPMDKRLTALEEAEYEDEDDEEIALDRELLMQSMETLRVHRPRILLYGEAGMGQTYVGAALLHHLEGYAVQSLELGTLLGDSTRTVEASIVQIFVEAKRHQPSIIYLPSLLAWCASVSETARATVKAMLDTLAPTDPVLLLAIIDGQFKDLPRDVRAWFGPSKENRVELTTPTHELREKFFVGLLQDVRRPPNQFLDGIKRKKRVLEDLPIAPPLEPRKPTAAETAAQEQNDNRVITLLKFRLGPILTELKRKYKRFTKRATDEYAFAMEVPFAPVVQTVTITEVPMEQNMPIEVVAQEPATQPLVNGDTDSVVHQVQAQMQQPPPPPKLYDMDLERMHTELYKDRYLTPQQFLEDVGKIVYNAQVHEYDDKERLLRARAMYTAAEVSIQEFDAPFRLECERMAVREKIRRSELKQAMGQDKDKGKQPEGIIRRSTRQNGQQVELPMTDPVQIERRLKRQRANGEGTDSNASDNDGRDNKRTRVVGGEGDMDADGEDELDLIERPTVHFADDVGHGHNLHGIQSSVPMSFNNHGQQLNGYHLADQHVHPYTNGQHSSGMATPQPSIANVSSLLNHEWPQNSQLPQSFQSPYQPLPSPNLHEHPAQYADHYPPNPYPQFQQGPPFGAGPSNFAPHQSLYNQHAGPSYSSSSGQGYNMPLGSMNGWQDNHNSRQPHHYQPEQTFSPPEARSRPLNIPIDPSLVPPPILIDEPENPFVVRSTEVLGSSASAVEAPTSHFMVVDEPDVSSSTMKSNSPEAAPKEPSPPPPPPPPVIERTPTPLPDFICDEELLSQLQNTLATATSSLNVEQLEQLRATCLAALWRRRTEWDRDSLIKELMDMVKDFVEEVGKGHDDDGDDDF